MSWLSKLTSGATGLAKGALPILSSVAPFIPGVGPLVKGGLMAANSLIQGSEADRKSRNLYSGMERNYQGIADQAGQQNDDLYQRMIPLLNQYQQTMNNGGIQNYDARFRNMIEGDAPQFNNAVANTMRDFGDRGIGLDSSVVGSAVGNLRNQQNAQAFNAQRGIITDANNQKNQMMMQGIPLLSGMMNQNNALRMNATQNMGGLGGMYQSQASGYAGGLGALGNLLPDILSMGKNTNVNAGNNGLGTNQTTGFLNDVYDPNSTMPESAGRIQKPNPLALPSMRVPKITGRRIRF